MEKSTPAAAVKNLVEESLRIRGFSLCDFDELPIKKKNSEATQEYLPKSGIVKVVATKQRQMVGGGKTQSTFVRHVIWDHDAGIAYGQPIGVRADGSVRFKEITINDERSFDLSKAVDRKDFYVLLHDANMEGGPRFKGTALFKMIDPEKEARAHNAMRKTKRTAEDIVENLQNTEGFKELSDFGVLFGINPNQSNDVIRRQLFEKADKEPEEVVQRFENPDRKIWVLVKRARLCGVIELLPDGLYFGGIALGSEEINAVERIKMQPDMIVGLQDSIAKKTGTAALPIGKKDTAQKPDGGAGQKTPAAKKFGN